MRSKYVLFWLLGYMLIVLLPICQGASITQTTKSDFYGLPQSDNLLGVWYMDEATDTHVTDFSGRGHNGELINHYASGTYGWEVGVIKNATFLNSGAGQFDEIELDNCFMNNGNCTGSQEDYNRDEITLNFWVYPTSFDQSTHGGLWGNVDGANNGIGLFWDAEIAGRLIFYGWDGLGGNCFVNSSTSVLATLNAWNMITMNYNYTTGDVQFFINGNDAGHDTLGCTVSRGTGGYYFGTNGNVVGGLAGKLDEAAIWNTSLTSNEVATLYRNGNYTRGDFSTPSRNQSTEAYTEPGNVSIYNKTFYNTGTYTSAILNTSAASSNWIFTWSGTNCMGCNLLFEERHGNSSNPHDIYTKLLLHMNGADGSTQFIDEYGHTITPYDNVHINTSEKKFGTASGLFDGDGDYLTVPNSDDFVFGTGDFTVDFWIRRQSKTDAYPIRIQPIAEDASNFAYEASNSATWIYFQDAWVIGPVTTPPLDTWTHVAIVRSGNTLYYFLDGTQIATADVTGKSINSNGGAVGVAIGSHDNIPVWSYKGWLDEIRISKGIARWTSNFAPPTSEYEFSSWTVIANNSDLPDGFNYWQIRANFTGNGTDSPRLEAFALGPAEGPAESLNVTQIFPPNGGQNISLNSTIFTFIINDTNETSAYCTLMINHTVPIPYMWGVVNNNTITAWNLSSWNYTLAYSTTYCWWINCTSLYNASVNANSSTWCFTTEGNALSFNIGMLILGIVLIAAIMFWLSMHGLGEGSNNFMRLLLFFLGLFIIFSAFGLMIISFQQNPAYSAIANIILTLQNSLLWITVIVLAFYIIRFFFGILSNKKGG